MFGQFAQVSQEPFLLYGVVLLAVTCLVFGLATLRAPTPAPATARKGSTSMDWVVTNVSKRFVPEDDRAHDDLKARLLQAGYDAPNAVQVYYGIRVAIAIIAPAAVIFVLPLYVALSQNLVAFLGLVAAIAGFTIPAYVVRARRAARQRAFRDGLPDVLDLMVVCCEAGLGIDTAIMKVAEQMQKAHPPMARQLDIVSNELRAGLARAAAMRGFANRTGIDETISMVNLLVQSDALGTSMAQTLRSFADEMRTHRMLKAEELAQKVSAKLTMILVACFLPGIFAAILAPAIYTAIKSIQSLSVTAPW